MDNNVLQSKLEELKQELKDQGLWKKSTPGWVQNFSEKGEFVDFLDWLQFVYMPNRLMYHTDFSYKVHENYLALQVKRFAGDEMMNHKIVALLVEIDAI